MPTRRTFLTTTLAAGALPVTALSETRIGDDGLHKQDWFLDSFLDLRDDLAEAAESGKGLVVLFEQRGCPYCAELHNVNFAHEELVGYLRENFETVQLDIWGSRAVTDFDGQEMEEKRLAERWGVSFTPTSVIVPKELVGVEKPAAGKSFRLPGYLKPFHHVSALEYVAGGHYRDQPFQRYLQDKFADLKARGIHPDVW